MKKVKILAIAPYKGMAETLSALADDREDIDVTIRTGNLQEGLGIAQSLMVHNNYDVIISRGGTAELIRKELDTLVVDTPLSVYDILRSIKMAENYAGKYAIAGFHSITDNARILCDLLKLDIAIFTFKSQTEVLPILLKLKSESYSLIICDMIGSLTAQSIGLNSIFIPSGTESVNSAINEAVALVNSNRQICRQKELFKTALISGQDTILIFMEKGQLWFSTLTGNPSDSQLMDMVRGFLPSFAGNTEQTFECPLNGYIYHITMYPLSYDHEQDILVKISKTPALFQEKDKTISIYNDCENQEISSEQIIENNSANFVGNIHTLIDKYAPSSSPVLIMGESGTGKAKAAALLYRHGPYRRRPFYVIDCSLLTERKWNTLLSNDNSPFHNINTTLHIKNIGKLTNSELLKLYTYIEDTGMIKRNRLIFSLITPDPNAGDIKNYLLNKLSCLLLPTEPLRKRLEDLSSIATLYINQMNALLGKQIIGFDPEAFQLIRSYHWPDNLDQFRRVLKELAILTTSSYISEYNVKMVLKQEEATENALRIPKYQVPLDLTKPLHDITYDIIQLVMAEENMNKEKTARRLGISRSTLWRFLKNN